MEPVPAVKQSRKVNRHITNRSLNVWMVAETETYYKSFYFWPQFKSFVNLDIQFRTISKEIIARFFQMNTLH